MMTSTREIVEGVIEQGIVEEITHLLDISAWGTGPLNIEVTVKDTETGEDVSAQVLTGAASAHDATHILLPTIHSLTADHEYRVDVIFDVTSLVTQHVNIYFYIQGRV